MWIKKQQLELTIGQLISLRMKKEHDKAICCHLIYLTYNQSKLYEMPGWINEKPELRFPGEISMSQICR